MQDQTQVPAMAASSLKNDEASLAAEPFEFSRLRIKQMTGRDPGEREYLLTRHLSIELRPHTEPVHAGSSS